MDGNSTIFYRVYYQEIRVSGTELVCYQKKIEGKYVYEWKTYEEAKEVYEFVKAQPSVLSVYLFKRIYESRTLRGRTIPLGIQGRVAMDFWKKEENN
jgi:hypothetical protein